MSPRAVRRRSAKKTSARRSTAKRMVQKVTGWNLGMQIGIAVSAMALLALLGVVDRNIFSAALGTAKDPTIVAVDIGLEHDAPTAVDMLVARKGMLGHIEVNNTSTFPLEVSLPEGWERTEVRGGSIWLVVQSDPEFGFVKWTIPAKMGMTLKTTQVPDEITFHSPSGQTASIRVTSVDIQTEERHDRSLLFQNVAQTKLWVPTE